MGLSNKIGDIFGIHTGIKSMIDVFLRNARGTGRTEFMIRGLQDGDKVIVASPNESQMIQQRFLMHEDKRGMRIHCEVVQPGDFGAIRFNTNNKGRLIFDHHWVELTYYSAIENVGRNIAQIQQHASGVHADRLKRMEQDAKYEFMKEYLGSWEI